MGVIVPDIIQVKSDGPVIVLGGIGDPAEAADHIAQIRAG